MDLNLNDNSDTPARSSWLLRGLCAIIVVAGLAGWARADEPTPLLAAGHPVQWWFVFKLNQRALARFYMGTLRHRNDVRRTGIRSRGQCSTESHWKGEIICRRRINLCSYNRRPHGSAGGWLLRRQQ